MLQVEDIHTYYGDSHILQGVSLNVNPGELVCLVGRNGAGKTTTIRSIIGFNKPRAGKVTYEGKDTTGMPPYKIAKMGIGLVPQGRRIFPDLSVQENLLFAHDKKRGSWDLNKVYSVFPRLKERQKNRGDQLSGGEQQMLAIARALLMNPSLILMDEPSEGLAPLIVREIGRIIKEVKNEGLSVLLVEQNLALGLSVADRCYVLNKGRIVYESSPDELRQNEQVKHQYLGV
ncbi:MAG TPA: ABC transporter ATP-binding protein [Chloroflexota bacterium]|nr:ABC transporter ATP-binding protein [Chloroflexota bacterium]